MKKAVVALLVVAALAGAGFAAKTLLHKPGFQLPAAVGGEAPTTQGVGLKLVESMRDSMPQDSVERVLSAYGNDRIPKFVLLAEKQGNDKAGPAARMLSFMPGTAKTRTIGSVDCTLYASNVFGVKTEVAYCAWATDHSSGAVMTLGDTKLEQLATVTEQARKDVEA